MAIGARSQSARTYLEKHVNSFMNCDLYELINHGIKALAGTLPNETKLNNKNLSICIVGKDHPYKCLDETETEAYINPDSSHGTGPSPGASDPSEVGVGGTERNERTYPPRPNPEDPIPLVATEQREIND